MYEIAQPCIIIGIGVGLTACYILLEKYMGRKMLLEQLSYKKYYRMPDAN